VAGGGGPNEKKRRARKDEGVRLSTMAKPDKKLISELLARQSKFLDWLRLSRQIERQNQEIQGSIVKSASFWDW
jgi:hypothetical protein